MAGAAGSIIRGVIFDKDGTLFHFGASWNAWGRTVLEDLAQGDPDRLRILATAIGYDLETQAFAPHSPAIAGTLDDIAALLAPHAPQHDPARLSERLQAAARHAAMVPAVDLPATLGALRGDGLRLGVVTNDSQQAALAHLQAAQIDGCFDFVAGYDAGFGSKPDCGQLDAFCAATGLQPDTVVMVGDSLHDLVAGRAAGMRCAGVLTGPATAQELDPQADVVLQDIGALRDWIAASCMARPEGR